MQNINFKYNNLYEQFLGSKQGINHLFLSGFQRDENIKIFWLRKQIFLFWKTVFNISNIELINYFVSQHRKAMEIYLFF